MFVFRYLIGSGTKESDTRRISVRGPLSCSLNCRDSFTMLQVYVLDNPGSYNPQDILVPPGSTPGAMPSSGSSASINGPPSGGASSSAGGPTGGASGYSDADQFSSGQLTPVGSEENAAAAAAMAQQQQQSDGHPLFQCPHSSESSMGVSSIPSPFVTLINFYGERFLRILVI